jgi:hypothetical protein
MASNTIYQQSEVMRTKMIPKWLEMSFMVLSDFIGKKGKGELQIIGERDYRIPYQTENGGRFGHYDPQMGDMGRGSSPAGNNMLQSFYSMRLNFELDQLQVKACESRKTSVNNPFVECVANGIREFELLFDKTIHGNGTPVMATSNAHSSGTGFSVYTMTNTFGTQLLRRGQFYCIYDSTLTTLKSAGVLKGTSINTQARTLTLSGIVPGAAAGDLICFEGVTGANPAAPRGLAYWVSSALSGTTAGVNRANENQIVSKSVSGASGLNVETVQALKDRIQMDRGGVSNLLGITSNAQRAYALAQMVAIQMPFITTGEAPLFDRLPKLKGKEFFDWGGVAHYVDIHADQTTNNYIDPSDFGRAQLAPTGFYETTGKSGADARFQQLYASSGAPASGVWFSLTKDEDIYCVNPGGQGVISALPVSSFYS